MFLTLEGSPVSRGKGVSLEYALPSFLHQHDSVVRVGGKRTRLYHGSEALQQSVLTPALLQTIIV